MNELKVSQRARDAAAEMARIAGCFTPEMVEAIRFGAMDHLEFVRQAFRFEASILNGCVEKVSAIRETRFDGSIGATWTTAIDEALSALKGDDHGERVG